LNNRLGTLFGNHIVGTIRKYNNNGTVNIALDKAGLSQPASENINVPLPVAWAGTDGELLAGFPKTGSQVRLSQGQGGEWFIIGYKVNEQLLSSALDFTNFKSGRLLGQVKGSNFFFLEPEQGFVTGKEAATLNVDPLREIYSVNLNSHFEFSSAFQHIVGPIARDLSEASSRASISSFLQDHKYDDFLFTVGLDPSTSVSSITTSGNIRNPALVESKSVTYEFDPVYDVVSPAQEMIRYKDTSILSTDMTTSRRKNRTDAFALSLEYPNHLIESIAGTGVDIFGNILDINRNILPIGKISSLSLQLDPDKSEAFKNITNQLRKSIAFHWELNARKPFDNSDLTPSNPNVVSDFDRQHSKLSIDIDKEGQLKINIPASSESGNIPLVTRTQNYSVLVNQEDSSIDPNAFVRSNNFQDIYLNSYAGNATIKLSSGENDLDGYASPNDRITNQPIKLGTAFHDITKVCNEFQKTANYIQAGLPLVLWDPDCRLNRLDSPLDHIVSDTITVNGDDANAGGRSITTLLDGMASLSVGANTIDRQSIWLDTAGSIVQSIGRDKNGISWAGNFDGDVLLEIGGAGLASTLDSRFSAQDASYRNGRFEIRCNMNGQLMIFRMGPNGIDIVSPGTLTFEAQQDIIFKTNSNLLMEAEQIVAYAETSKRIIQRSPIGQSIG
jgi:hypothetical protein